jgi:hypothetical protein
MFQLVKPAGDDRTNLRLTGERTRSPKTTYTPPDFSRASRTARLRFDRASSPAEGGEVDAVSTIGTPESAKSQ